MWCDRLVRAVAFILRAFSAIRRSFVETDSELCISVVFPSSGSSTRRPLRSAGSLGTVSLLPRYYEALRLLDDHPASLRFLRSAVPTCAPSRSLPHAPSAAHAGRGLVEPGPSSPGLFHRNRRGLPGSCETPVHARPVLGPRWDGTPDHVRRVACCLASLNSLGSHGFLVSRGSITRLSCSLSTLRGAGSPPPLARLAFGWWSAFAEQGWIPAGSRTRFHVSS